jgi:CelD/BcsL family acetyltransferase involved in cellulose biosynthesis
VASFGEELRLVVIERDGELAAAAPLAARGRALELVGVRDLYEPADFAYLDQEALDALARELTSLKAGIVIPRVSKTSPTVAALRRAFRGRGALFARAAGATPVLDLAEDPEQHFNVRRRADVRRARRRAEELGPVSAEVLTPGVDEVEGLLAKVFEVEAAGWKGARGTALAQDPSRRRFFEEYARAVAAEGALRVSVLRIGEETAAVQLAVEHARRLWLLKIGYDERFSRCSPGTLLLLETARWAIGQGLEAIELLGQAETWTRFWTEDERACLALHAYPATARGAGSLVGDAVGHSRRRVLRGVIERSGRGHIAGPDLDSALAASRELAGEGLGVALAYWNAPDDSPTRVEAVSLAALEGLAESGLGGYLAMKPAALGFDRGRINPILARAAELGLGIHFDSTGPEEAEPSWELLAEIAGPEIGCTLPSRWGRSLVDAERAVELGLRARVVKGQWPDPDYWARDEQARFLDIVEVLAGRSGHVAIATHDRALAAAAIARLEDAGTPVEHEVMLGLPRRSGSLAPTRVYVPFGHPYLPYAPARARRHPRVAGWIARDFVRGAFRRG